MCIDSDCISEHRETIRFLVLPNNKLYAFDDLDRSSYLNASLPLLLILSAGYAKPKVFINDKILSEFYYALQ